MRTVVALALCCAGAASALEPPPQGGAAAREDFAQYREAMPGKAFVIGPGGAWAWRSGLGSGEAALAEALAACRTESGRPCFPYAVDATAVFDARAWARAWRPYLSAAEARARPVGLMPGARFPDIEFADAQGRAMRLSQLRGKPVVLHFWGSWCAPCRHELPDMAAFARSLRARGVVFVPLQVRESFADARRWLAAQRVVLPLYDSGMRSGSTGDLRVAGGGQLPDRAVAPVFPSSVFLDRHGVIVLNHYGPIERWADYRPQLEDLLATQKP